MTEQEFKKAIQELGIDITEIQLKQLEEYKNFLIEYNNHTNLTAIKTSNEIYLKHFYDSLTISKVIDFNEPKTILDIGTGAGFPGIVLAIIFPNQTVHLMDSNHKKIDFLDALIQKIQIKNVKTIYARSEEYALSHKEEYDIITSRAVAELRILLEISFPLLKINGLFIAMKSSIEKELEEAKDTIELLFGFIEQCITFELPWNEGFRSIIKIKKQKPTPSIYPRNYGTIRKKALKKKEF